MFSREERFGPAWENDAAKDSYALELAARCEVRARELGLEFLIDERRGVDNDDEFHACLEPALSHALSRVPAMLYAERRGSFPGHGRGQWERRGEDSQYYSDPESWAYHGPRPADWDDSPAPPGMSTTDRLMHDMRCRKVWAEGPFFSDDPTDGEVLAWKFFKHEFTMRYYALANPISQRKLQESQAALARALEKKDAEREQQVEEIKSGIRKGFENGKIFSASVKDFAKVCKALSVAHSGAKAKLLERIRGALDGTTPTKKRKLSEMEKIARDFAC